MKISQLSLLFFLSALLINCEKNENSDVKPDAEEESVEPEPEVSEEIAKEIYFTVNVDPLLKTSETENWIILHNSDGNLLDYRSYESGDILVFESEPINLTDEIALTSFSYRNSEGEIRHTLKTFLEIKKESIWNFKPFSSTNYNNLTGEQIGAFDVTISNIIKPFSFETSDISGILPDNENFRIITGNTATKTHKLFEKSEEHMFSIFDGNGDFKYTFVKNIIDKDLLELDYSDFNEFDIFLSINPPPNGSFIAEVYGLENDQEFVGRTSFLLNSLYAETDEIQNSINLGYLNRFNKYQTLVIFNTDDYFYLYENYGNIPENISIPENKTITISDQSISNFSFSTNVNFVRKINEFVYKQGEIDLDFIENNWQIESSNSEAQTFEGSIPEELLVKYPEFIVADLVYTKTYLYLSFGSYSEYLQKRFVSAEPYGKIRSQELISFQK